ncbi:MAG TPA: nuclear transport factor 2 family protein [Solirubrobacteraceae bacterium]|jgi:hypothetical protein|nr:nuclear transport factor 2 family protein [Solirubrobacteraceae bacterium]
MTAPRTIASLCASSLLATGMAACGATTTVSTGAFKGEQQLIAQTVAHLQSHATALEAKKICGEDLAAARVAQLNTASGGCKQAIESQLKEIDSFETTVQAVKISGATATAQVKSIVAGRKAVQTMTFAKEGGKWRVSSVG